MKTLRNIRQVTGEVTARQAHGSPSYCSVGPRDGPRTARPPRRVYAAVRGWLRRYRGSGWVPVARLADMATVDLSTKISASTMGYVLQREYPGVPARVQRIRKDNRFQTIKSSVEYDTGFLTKYLDDDYESC